MMNTLELERILETDECIRKIFQGALPADYLQDLTNLPACFIANTEKSSHEGTHWLTFHFDEKGHGLMFDILGEVQICSIQLFRNLWIEIVKHGHIILYNFNQHFPIVAVNFVFMSYVCSHMDIHITKSSISKTDLAQNNQLVSQFTEKYFNTTQL